MATIVKKQHRVRQFGHTPYGNFSTILYTLDTAAAGYVIDSNVEAGPIAIGDVIDLGPLQEGFRLEDCQIRVITPMTAAVVGNLGFKYGDGIDSVAVPQDDDYFGAGLVLNATGVLRFNRALPVVKLPKEARLVLTLAGAANAKASKIEIFIRGEMGSP